MNNMRAGKEQQLFLGFAQIWCKKCAAQEVERLHALTDPHSSGRFRVNGVLQNMPEFDRAFACTAGQPMVSPRACRVWGARLPGFSVRTSR
jgi:putative endopeptidase